MSTASPNPPESGLVDFVYEKILAQHGGIAPEIVRKDDTYLIVNPRNKKQIILLSQVNYILKGTGFRILHILDPKNFIEKIITKIKLGPVCSIEGEDSVSDEDIKAMCGEKNFQEKQIDYEEKLRDLWANRYEILRDFFNADSYTDTAKKKAGFIRQNGADCMTNCMSISTITHAREIWV